MTTKPSMGTFALSFAATAVLFAPAIVQAQGGGRTATAPTATASAKHTTGSEETVHYDGAAEARKVQARAAEHPASTSSSLCSLPYRMTAQDGCQR